MVNHGAITINPPDQRIHITGTLWRWLGGNSLLVVAGLVVFILLLCATFIRQVPGQIADDPAAAARWLLTVSEEYGILGPILGTLGLFDVLHNPLLQVLLAVITLILLIHLANLVAALWRLQQVPRTLSIAVDAVGAPMTLPATQPLYRWRQTVSQEPEALAAQFKPMLSPHFAELLSATVKALSVDLHHNGATASVDAPKIAAADDAIALPPTMVTELRLLGRRHAQRWIWLRPLLLLGLLLALIGVWITLVVGWEVTSPLLAPGDQYRATTQRVALTYAVIETDGSLTPTLEVEMNEATSQVPLGESRRLYGRQMTLQAAPGPPALWLRSADDAVTFSQPGQSQNTTELGLIFPTLGREESVVVGGQVGLRIVRVAVLPAGIKIDEQDATNADALSHTNNSLVSPIDMLPQEQFLLEVYQSDAEPVQTLVINRPAVAKIQLNGKVWELTIVPLPSMTAVVHYQPAIWLLWVALGLVLVGLVGFWYRPAFLLVQLAPWPTARTVVVAQSDVAAEIERVRFYLAEVVG